jgi:5-methyltetrahydropteroyltriglutamate--homocysteine methyltransferase
LGFVASCALAVWAALTARNDPAEELEFAVSLINRVVDGVAGARIGVHVCRGNWSRDESTLLSGGYQALAGCLNRLAVTQLVLEYATDRLAVSWHFRGAGSESTHAPTRSSVDDPVGRRRGAAPLTAAALFLNPTAASKRFPTADDRSHRGGRRLVAMVSAARDLRGSLIAPDASRADCQTFEPERADALGASTFRL